MGLGSWALSPHPHSQTWPQGKQQTQVRCVPFSGEPSSLTPSCPRYISMPRCAWGSQVEGPGEVAAGRGHGRLRQACP